MYIEDFKIGAQVVEDVIGKTYQGEDRKTGKIALVKILHPILADRKEFVRAFHEGAATSRRLKSQHFCRTLSHGAEHGKNYVVLQHFDHIQLSTILRRQHVLSIFDAPGVVEKLAVALRTLHLAGEVHGAITPDCVFFTKTLDSAKVCNFGYEKLIRLLIFEKHPGLKSSIRYFSPELITGQRHLHRQSDVYSLGVLFYRLLVGNTPWQSAKFEDFFSGKRRRPIIPPSLRRLEIPSALDSVIIQAVEDDIDDRCANLSLFIQQIAGERANILATLTPTTAFVFNDDSQPHTDALRNGAGGIKRNIHNDATRSQVDADLAISKMDLDSTLPEPPIDPELGRDSDLGAPSQFPEIGHGPDGAQELSTAATQTGPIFPGQPGPLDEEPEQRTTQELPAPDSNQMDEPAFDFGETTTAPPSVESAFSTDATLAGDIPPSSAAKQPDTPEQTVGNRDGMPDYRAPAAELTSTLRTPLPADTDELFLESGPAAPEFPMLQSDEFDDRVLGLMRRDPRPTNGHATNGAMMQANGQRISPVSGPSGVGSNAQSNGARVEPTLAGAGKGHVQDDMMDYDEDFATTQTVDIRRSALSGWSPMTVVRILLVTILPIAIVLLVLTFSLDLDFSQGLDGLKDGFFPSQSKKTQVMRKRRVQRRPATTRNGSKESGSRSNSTPRAIRRPAPTKARDTARRQPAARPGRPVQNTAQAANAARSSNNNSAQREPARASASTAQTVQLALLVQNAGAPLQANIFVDGAIVGRTNQRGTITVSGLTPGEAYLVKVEMKGFQVWAKEFVAAGPGISNLVADLISMPTVRPARRQPAASTPRQRPRRSSAGPAAPTRRTAPKPRKTQAGQSRLGTISVLLTNVESLSDVYIYVNGALWNGRNFRAPAQLELPPGTYVIEVKKDGYLAAPPSYTVNIINGETRTATFILTAN